MQPHESPSPFYIWKFTAKLKNIGLKTKKNSAISVSDDDSSIATNVFTSHM